MKLIIISPCLLSPFYVYRGSGEKEYRTAAVIRKLVGGLGGEWQLLTYPCPEYLLMGWPRAPASREVFEKLGMYRKAGEVARFIGRIIGEEKPERMVFVGVKGSPTCGVFHTSSGDPETYPYSIIESFRHMNKKERFRISKKLSRSFKPVEKPGILFEIIREMFPEAVYVEFDKDDIDGSIRRLEEAVERP